jgi:hypothetical protein
VVNCRNAILVASRLVDDGIVTPLLPHLVLLWDLVDPRPVDFWLAYDELLIRRSDAVLRLPGESVGADREIAFADGLGMPVFEDKAALYEWAENQLPPFSPPDDGTASD